MKKNFQFSAPRIDKLYFSPEYTPSAFQVKNVPLNEEHFFKFEDAFDSSLVITEENEQDYSYQNYKNWLSKSCDKMPLTPIQLKTPKYVQNSKDIIANTPPPPGFQPKIIFPIQEIGIEESESPDKIKKEENGNPQINNESQQDLQLSLSGQLYIQRINSKASISNQPNKRALRGTFEKEKVDDAKYTGTLKFYDLKKRFGFILMDNGTGDVFLCEDDIYLSNINLKNFKEEVKKRQKIRFRFKVKFYQEKEKTKRKAIDIEIETPTQENC